MRPNNRCGLRKARSGIDCTMRSGLYGRMNAYLSKYVHPSAVLPLLIIFVGFASILGLMAIKGGITGFVTGPVVAEYNDVMNINISGSQEIVWYPQEQGIIGSLRINGRFVGDSETAAKVVLVTENEKYLVWDLSAAGDGILLDRYSSEISGDDDYAIDLSTSDETDNIAIVSGRIDMMEYDSDDAADFVLATATDSTIDTSLAAVTDSVQIMPQNPLENPPEDARIAFSLEYGDNPEFDRDNDGIESIDGVIDFALRDAIFSWNVNESNLCTVWTVGDSNGNRRGSSCHGSSLCCSFAEMRSVSADWDRDYYSYFGLDGAEEENIISAQILYVDYSLASENLYSYIHYSERQSRKAVFREPIRSIEVGVQDSCIDSCVLPGLDEPSYRIVFDIHDEAVFELHNITYLIIGKSGLPEEVTIDLTILDSRGNEVAADVAIFDNTSLDRTSRDTLAVHSTTSIESSTREILIDSEKERNVLTVKRGIVDAEILPRDYPIKRIDVEGLVAAKNIESFIRIDDLSDIADELEENPRMLYAIDPTSVDFSRAIVHSRAMGDEGAKGMLFKCESYNFTSRECDNLNCSDQDEEDGLCVQTAAWVKAADITSGRDYSFEITPDDPIFYEVYESQDESISDSGEYENKISKQFIPDVDGYYLVIASAEASAYTTSYSVDVRSQLNGNALSEASWEPHGAYWFDDYQTYFMHDIVHLEAGSENVFEMDYKSGKQGVFASIRNARALIFDIDEYHMDRKTEEVLLGSTYQDIAKVSFDLDEAGRYLIIASGEYRSGSTRRMVYARMSIDSQVTDSANYKAKDHRDYKSFGFHKISELGAGSHEIVIDAKGEMAGYGRIRNVKVTAIRIDGADMLIPAYSTERNDAMTIVSPRFADIAVLELDVAEAGNYTILSTAQLGGHLAKQSLSAVLEVDGNIVSDMRFKPMSGHQSPDMTSFATSYTAELTSGAHIIKLKARPQFLPTPVYVQNARVTALMVDTSEQQSHIKHFEIISPAAGFSYGIGDDATIKVNETIDGIVSMRATARNAQGQREVMLEYQGEGIWKAMLHNLTHDGEYLLDVTALDSNGAVIDNQERVFSVCEGCPQPITMHVIIFNSTTTRTTDVEMYPNEDGSYEVRLINVTPPIEKIIFHRLFFENYTIEIGVDDLVVFNDEYGNLIKRQYGLDFGLVNHSHADVYVTAEGKQLYKCPTWNFTTQECPVYRDCIGDTKDTKVCNIIGGWHLVESLNPGEIYDFMIMPGDPGYIEYNSDFTAPYCSTGESPCIADSSMLQSVGNAAGTQEPNQPNTIDVCSDGTLGTYLVDESVENITITSLNDSLFRAGDTIQVNATVHCWEDGSSGNINLVYTNSSVPGQIGWRVVESISPCPAGGMVEVEFEPFALDSMKGNHTVRVINQYLGSTDATCGIGDYDDNDDVVFLVRDAKYVPDTVILNFTSNAVWTVPQFISKITVQAWGGGGAGGGATSNQQGGAGGGGGQFAMRDLNVSQGGIYNIIIGTPGVGSTGAGTAGGDTSFNSTLVVAKGGSGGGANNAGAIGLGNLPGSIGDVIYFGGNGANPSGAGGGGGGGAGSTESGNNAAASIGGTGGAEFGGNGGNGVVTGSAAGSPGNAYGGAGGGARRHGGNQAGGAGAQGFMTITYEYPFCGGDGSVGNPYLICDADGLNAMRYNLSANYRLNNPIDLNVHPYNTGQGWQPIGNSTNPFIGTLNGSGYLISNLYINRSTSNYIGLFGYLNSAPGTSSMVHSVGLENIRIIGNGYTGGIAGYISGAWNAASMISESYVSGTINGGGSTGCMVGYSAYQSYIKDSYTMCNVTGGWGTGGFSGSHWGGQIINSYAIAEIGGSGSGRGGFIGQGSSIVNSSYWNVDLFAVSSLGEGKTTEQLQQISTFGTWDIALFEDHESEIWYIKEHFDYPRLGWEDRTYESMIELSINTPLNTIYDTSLITVNITAHGAVIDSIWYNWNGTNITYVNPLVIEFNEGNNTLYAWANDTAGSIVSSSVIFIVDTFRPSIAGLYLNATSINNLTYDNLTCNYELNGTSTTSAINWYKNNESIMLLNMPFEGNETNALLDYSGHSSTAVNNNVIWNSTGGYNGTGGFEFDGYSSYLDISDDEMFDNFSNLFSVSVWARANSWQTPDHNPIVWKGSQIGWGANYLFRIALSSGTPTWGVTCGTTEGWFAGGGVSLNTWNHYVLTFDGTTTRAFINGVLVGSSTDCSGQSLNIMSGYPVRSGYALRSSLTEETWFNGSIDDVRIYNTALSGPQISALFSGRQDLIVSEETEINDLWMCEVTPFDQNSSGSTYQSNDIIILNESVFGIAIISPIERLYNNASQILDISVTGSDIDSIWYSWNGTNATYVAPLLIEFNEGNNTLYAWVNDTYGNVSSESVDFEIDSIPPTIDIISPENRTYYTSNVMIDIDVYDSNLDTILYDWNGTNATYNGTVPLSLADGNYTLYVWVNDTAGNSDSSIVSFQVLSGVYNGVPYCYDGKSPCVADSDLLKCRNGVNDGNGPEPNNPNTIDDCTDGTSTFLSPSCGGDESVENITIVSTVDDYFREGDMIDVSSWVHCYGTNNYIGLIYTSNASNPDWQVIQIIDDACGNPGYEIAEFEPFLLDNTTGDHAVRVYITYDLAPNLSQTCAVRSSGNRYDDNDDVVVRVFEHLPPNLVINSPQDITYITDEITIDISAESRVGLDSIWYSLSGPGGDINASYSGALNLTLDNGNYTLHAWANNSYGIINYANVSFIVDVMMDPPEKVMLYSPANATSEPELMPTFAWNNSFSPSNATLSYQLMVSAFHDFSGDILVNMSDIPEDGGSQVTNYTIGVNMMTDTQYYWRVRAYDGSQYGEWSDTWEYYAEGTVSFRFIVQNVTFGSVEGGMMNDTTDDNPMPYIIENDGNVDIDIDISVIEPLWDAVSLDSEYFMFRIDDRHRPGSFNVSASLQGWQNFSSNNLTAIRGLSYTDMNDSAVIDVAIKVPIDESAGLKNAVINFIARKS